MTLPLHRTTKAWGTGGPPLTVFRKDPPLLLFPMEIYEKIFSFLNGQEIWTFAHASRRTRQITWDVETGVVNRYAQYLIHTCNGKGSVEPIETLQRQASGDLGRYIWSVEDWIAERIGSLEDAELDAVAQKVPPVILHGISELLSWYQWIKWERETRGRDVESVSWQIPQILERYGSCVSLATRVAHTIDDEGERMRVLNRIVSTLIQHKKWPQAIRVASTITIEQEKEDSFSSIARGLVQSGDMDQACDVVENILSVRTKIEIYRDMIQSLTLSGAKRKIDQAVRIAEKIPEDWAKGKALAEISVAFSRCGETDDALKVAKTIRDEWQRDAAFGMIVQEFVKREGNVDVALEILTTHVIHEENKDLALTSIIFYLLHGNIGEIRKATLLTHLISDVSMRDQAFEKITRTLSSFEGNELEWETSDEEMIGVADQISVSLREEVFFQIGSQLMIKKGEVNKAMQIVGRMRRGLWQTRLLGEISYAYVRRKDRTRAIAVAQMIPEEEVRKWALQRCELENTF